jgi:hypothetical protein
MCMADAAQQEVPEVHLSIHTSECVAGWLGGAALGLALCSWLQLAAAVCWGQVLCQ